MRVTVSLKSNTEIVVIQSDTKIIEKLSGLNYAGPIKKYRTLVALFNVNRKRKRI